MASGGLTYGRSDLLNSAAGRWPEVLAHFGLEERFLRPKKSGPCPLCGGVDRYHFSDSYDCGSYHCRKCGGGNGYTLLRKFKGWDDATAMREIELFLKGAPASRQPLRGPPRKSSGEKLADIKTLIASCTSPWVVAQYLDDRRIRQGSPVLLGHAECLYIDKDLPAVSGRRFPAMVAPITGPRRGIVNAARHYVSDEIPVGNKKKFMPTPWQGALEGAVCRLHEPIDGKLLVGEGVITALSAAELFRLPAWAAMTAWGLEHFEPPPRLVELFIAGDNDSSFTGQAAAYALATRLRRERPEIAVKVEIPLAPDSDWADVLSEARS